MNPAKMYAWKMVIYSNSVSASRRVVLTWMESLDDLHDYKHGSKFLHRQNGYCN